MNMKSIELDWILFNYIDEFYIDNVYVKADDEIIRSIYQAVKYTQMFIKDYDRIKAVIESSDR